MTIKSFGRKFVHGIEHAGDSLAKASGKAAGSILGGAAANSLMGYMSAAAPVAAEAAPMLLLKTGGYVKGSRNKPVTAILHGGERVLPYGVKATKYQKKVIASNKRKQRAGTFV